MINLNNPIIWGMGLSLVVWVVQEFILKVKKKRNLKDYYLIDNEIIRSLFAVFVMMSFAATIVSFTGKISEYDVILSYIVLLMYYTAFSIRTNPFFRKNKARTIV